MTRMILMKVIFHSPALGLSGRQALLYLPVHQAHLPSRSELLLLRHSDLAALARA